jgi:quinol monooxygenase YgiN
MSGRQEGAAMVTVGVLARLEAKPGKEEEVASFLAGALPLAEQEEKTTAWFATRLGPSTFGIFDVFPDESGREVHLLGPIATALMQRADELLSEPPTIQKIDILASKLSE